MEKYPRSSEVKIGLTGRVARAPQYPSRGLLLKSGILLCILSVILLAAFAKDSRYEPARGEARQISKVVKMCGSSSDEVPEEAACCRMLSKHDRSAPRLKQFNIHEYFVPPPQLAAMYHANPLRSPPVSLT